jgi:hypothetical protein
VFTFDTTTLTNGVHTIAWIVRSDTGETAGVGSRYFSVSNGSLRLEPNQPALSTIPATATLDVPSATAARTMSPRALEAEIDRAPLDPASILGRRGFDRGVPLRSFAPAAGVVTVQSEELNRVELYLNRSGGLRCTGYLRTPDGLAPLPVGSTLNAQTCEFVWVPGPGFVGAYTVVFVRWNGGTPVARQDVDIVLNPKGR